ncbi:MAG: hypothetical protein QHC40_10235 [Sphingobium sp.]|nr:hypothetical protein [Sphingobium sp.]
MSMRFACLSFLAPLALASGCAPSSGESAGTADASGPGGAVASADPVLPEGNGASPDNQVAEVAPRPARVDAPAPASAALDLPASNAAAPASAFPAEVTSFMVDRDGCDHFRGEEPYDPERAAYLEENIRELCTGTDVKLALLRQRYAADPDVLAALGNYEDGVEQPQ